MQRVCIFSLWDLEEVSFVWLLGNGNSRREFRNRRIRVYEEHKSLILQAWKNHRELAAAISRGFISQSYRKLLELPPWLPTLPRHSGVFLINGYKTNTKILFQQHIIWQSNLHCWYPFLILLFICRFSYAHSSSRNKTWWKFSAKLKNTKQKTNHNRNGEKKKTKTQTLKEKMLS